MNPTMFKLKTTLATCTLNQSGPWMYTCSVIVHVVPVMVEPSVWLVSQPGRGVQTPWPGRQDSGRSGSWRLIYIHISVKL